MLRGEVVGLRARHESDVPVLHAELHDDVSVRVRTDPRPWRPVSPGSAASPFAVAEPADNVSVFSVVRLSDEALIGAAVLWGIDMHNRMAHIGISLRPDFRGQGFATDTVRLLCEYGFAIRGLHRLQIETLADNDAMIATAERAGFAREGRLRESAWVAGSFVDEVVLGRLAPDHIPPVTSNAAPVT